MSDSAPEVVVEVSQPEATPETPSVVVVEDNGGEGNTDVALVVGELSARVAAIEERIPVVENAAEDAQSTADAAVDIAIDTSTETAPEPEVDVTEVIEEAVAESQEAEAETDEPPQRTHWFHRPWSEWKANR